MMNHVDRVQLAKRLAQMDPTLPEAKDQAAELQADILFMGTQLALLQGRIKDATPEKAEEKENRPPPAPHPAAGQQGTIPPEAS